jgi:AAA domain
VAHPEVIAPGCLTEMFSPRGLGKSILAKYWAVQVTRTGKRVLILDRDNPRRTLKAHLRALGAEDLDTLGSIGREKCPPLTEPEKWASFPWREYDFVVVDALDSMAEGIGEQDSSKPARAMAVLLDICHRENGPAVLVIGNTVRTAKHSRGSGVVEDCSDVVFELRDGTDLKPSGRPTWIEDLPEQGAADWQARSSRRKERTSFRLALVPTKFRLEGGEPAPRMLELDLSDEPWTVRDVTHEINRAGEEALVQKKKQKAARHGEGVALLTQEIECRAAAGQSAPLKTEAEKFLTAAGFKREEARTITAGPVFKKVHVPGRGYRSELSFDGKSETAAEIPHSPDPSVYAPSEDTDFGRVLQQRTAEIDPSQTRMNKGDFEPGISAADGLYTPHLLDEKQPLSGANGTVPEQGNADEEVRI